MTTNLRNPTTIPMYITPYLMQDITTTPTPKLPQRYKSSSAPKNDLPPIF